MADETSAEVALRYDTHDAEVIDLPARPPIDVSTVRATSIPKPWETLDPTRRPVIAEWLREAEQRKTAIRWWLAARWHAFLFHAVRLPTYAVLLVFYSPRGVVYARRRLLAWLDEGRPLRTAAIVKGDHDTYLKHRADLRRAREERRITMWVIRIGLAILAGAFAWWANAHSWAYIVAGVLAVIVFGCIGQSPDRPIFAPAVIPGQIRKLSPSTVVRAFQAAKLCTEDAPLTFATPIHRDANGWAVIVDLPFTGATADQAIAKRDVIASGLDVDERQVFLRRVRGVSGSARRVWLWVCDVDPLTLPAGRSRLNDAKAVNFWKPWPFGLNERGELVELCVLWGAMLIGAIPRRGKTFVARLVALAGALDPHVRLLVFDLKGGPDWTPFEQVADRIFYGDRPDPDTGVHPLAALRDTIDELLAEVDRRNRELRKLPKDVCPEGKLTEELTRTKGLGFELILLVVDEVQRAFINKEYKADLEEKLTDLAKVGPSAGIITVAATQKPDAQSTPTGFRDQFGIRFALYMTNRHASEAILGAGAGSEGLRADELPPDAVGSGILRGTGDAEVNGGVVRTGYADAVDAEKICARGRALREQAGTLTGMAIEGVTVSATPADYRIDRDLAVVFGGADKLHSDVLCARLADRWPDRYAGWTPVQLAAALVPYDIRTRDTWAPSLEDDVPRNRKGVLRKDLFGSLGE